MVRGVRGQGSRFRMGTGLLLLILGSAALAQTSRPAEQVEGTELLTMTGDLAAQMVAGIDRYLMQMLDRSEAARGERAKTWKDNHGRGDARFRLARSIGIDPLTWRRRDVDVELIATTQMPSRLAATPLYTVDRVRWPVLDGVYAEGLLLKPTGEPVACVVALPDADWTPEMIVGWAPPPLLRPREFDGKEGRPGGWPYPLTEGMPAGAQYARRLAENGCLVLVPTLIDRGSIWSGNPKLGMTAQPHREYIYRMAYEMGQHIIGYEVQKVLAAVQWLRKNAGGPGKTTQVGVIGYGEGGLLALHAASLFEGIDATMVSGHFQSRQQVWREPIYRNVWGLLRDFGDAELAAMIAPRALIIEASAGPRVDGPPTPGSRRPGSPGVLTSPPIESVRHEFERARRYYRSYGMAGKLQLVEPDDRDPGPGCEAGLRAFLSALGRDEPLVVSPPLPPLRDALHPDLEPNRRLARQFHQLVDYTQRLIPKMEEAREEACRVEQVKPIESLNKSNVVRRERFWKEVIGKVEGLGGGAVRSRLWMQQPKWTGYEVVLEMGPDVFAYGILLVPRDLQAGERRPVVVCQHGLEGRPQHVCEPGYKSPYNWYGAKLADLGYVVYAPQNPYIGGESFRVLQRKANPLGVSIFSFIVAQHQRTLEWLSTLSYVDKDRIAFYGLSYGGKTAMRVPAILTQYCLSICSGDFNEWIRKSASVDYPNSYMFTHEYEMPEFAMAREFSYAEMASLIAPRPFMVERGHHDPVGTDEWVSYEYAKVRRMYAELGIPERTEIEYFPARHEIHGVGTFEFLKKHLGWPK